MTHPSPAAPRGRHAPPLEVRQDRQRARLFAAAAAVFARMGYADASAEAIAALPEIRELNIGHFLVGEALSVGLAETIRLMKAAIARGRVRAAA